MSAIPKELKMILNRSLWLYAAVVLVFAIMVDYKKSANQRAHYLLGVFYNQDLQNYKDGIVYFDYLIHQKPTESRNYFLLGYCYLQLLNYHRAVHYFEGALKLAPQERSYQIYLDAAKAKMADANAKVTFPSERIVIPIE